MNRVHVQLDTLFYRDRDEWDYVAMLNRLMHDQKGGRNSRLGLLSYCLFDAPYDRLLFLSWSWIWREAVKFGVRYRVGDEDTYFYWIHNRAFFIISPKERAKLYLKVPDW